MGPNRQIFLMSNLLTFYYIQCGAIYSTQDCAKRTTISIVRIFLTDGDQRV